MSSQKKNDSFWSAAPPPQGENLERSVRAERRALLVERSFFIWKIGTPAYLAFFFLDLFSAPKGLEAHFLSIRLIVAFFMTTIVQGLRFRWGKQHVELLSGAIIFAAVLGIEVMCPLIGGFGSSYYVGIMVVCFVVGAYLPWTVPTTFGFSALVLLGYYTLNFWLGPDFHIKEIIEASFFLGGTIFFLIFSAVAHDSQLRRDVGMRLELERVNSDLLEANEAKSRLFANVSHELRTPLTLIMGPLESLLRDAGSKELKETFLSMLDNGRRLLRQVNALLDVAKSEAGRLRLEPTTGNLGEKAQRLVELAQSHAQTKSVRLETEGLDRLPETSFDEEKMEIVVANLLSNAIKFTPAGGLIQVRGRFEDGNAILEVEDSGPGVPADLREKVFERFYQVDGSRHRVAGGTGVGLSLSRELARLHGGELVCEGAPGGGSLFRATVPEFTKSLPERRQRFRRREDQLAAVRLETMASKALQAQQRGATLLADVSREKAEVSQRPEIQGPEHAPLLLVVEDNPDLSRFVVRSLVDEYRVLSACDGVEGLELALRHRPQVIVSDVMMPRMDGYELCRRLREKLEKQPVVVLVTARSGVEAVVEGLEVGADDYVTKPFEVKELKARIAAHLRSRNLEQRVGEQESRLIAIGSMTGAIIHDLRNPLAAVVGLKELALERVSEQDLEELEDLREDLEELGSAASRIQSMLEELLDFTRTGTQKIRLASVDVGAFFERLIAAQTMHLSEHEIRVEQEVELPTPCFLEIDAPRLERVFENLFTNARDVLLSGVPAGRRRIRFSARLEGSELVVEVSDNGPGIPADLVDSLFEPFATRGKTRGTGLGLATARNWVVAHQGRIDAAPKGKDGGACFTVALPARPSRPPAQIAEAG